MSCDRCDEFRDRGENFCPFCGEEFREDCPSCEEYKSKGSRFCAVCGKRFSAAPAPRRKDTDTESTLRSISVWIVPIVLLLLIIETAYLVGGTVSVWDWASTRSMDILVLIPNLVVATTISGAGLQIAWILLEVSILMSIAVMGYQTWKVLSSRPEPMKGTIVETPLYSVSMIFGASFVMSLITAMISMMLGSGITPPGDMASGNTPQALLEFADAAVWEEVITRMAYIGLPMMVVGYVCKRKGSWKFLFGGFGMSRVAMVLIVISALVFGFAHMPGWGFSKVIPSAVAGLLFGYLYVKVGVHASILVHFLTDYLAVVVLTGLMGIISIMTLAIMALGAICLVLLVIKLIKAPARIKEMPNWVPPVQESMFSRRDRD